MSDKDLMDCHAAMRILWEYLDEELSSERAHDVRAHLAGCAECYRHYRFEARFLEALESAARDECAPPELRSRVMDALSAEGWRAEFGEC
jgi:anti-sigma factor (TIGR02949 family)